jgi:hypothetical protein
VLETVRPLACPQCLALVEVRQLVLQHRQFAVRIDSVAVAKIRPRPRIRPPKFDKFLCWLGDGSCPAGDDE